MPARMESTVAGVGFVSVAVNENGFGYALSTVSYRTVSGAAHAIV